MSEHFEIYNGYHDTETKEIKKWICSQLVLKSVKISIKKDK